MELKAGKLPPELLERLVFGRLGAERPEVLVPAALGEDATTLDLGGELCVASTDPITGSGSRLGRLAVHISCNDVASNGAEPVAVLLTLLLPEGWSDEDLAALMQEAHQAAREAGIAIAGGHTEVTPGLGQAIAVTTVIGRVSREEALRTAGARPGDAIVLTKGAGLEGTAILAWDYADRLEGRIPADLLDRARGLGDLLSVLPEARLARRSGVHALHDVTEGGVLGAVYEMMVPSGLGVRIEAAAIPVRLETAAVCAALGVDPLRLIGSGALLAATDRPAELLAALRGAGIEAAVIGEVLADAAVRVVVTKEGEKPLEPPESDELWWAKARLR